MITKDVANTRVVSEHRGVLRVELRRGACSFFEFVDLAFALQEVELESRPAWRRTILWACPKVTGTQEREQCTTSNGIIKGHNDGGRPATTPGNPSTSSKLM